MGDSEPADDMMVPSSLLRVAVVQFAPKLGEVGANIAKARELCKGLIPRSIDLVCLPEMIFSGYNFPDAPSIAPYLEHPKTGPTATFCSDLARHLQCYVTAGFPEHLSPSSTSPITSTSTSASTSASTSPSPSTTGPIGANTAVLYAPNGVPVHSYRKTNLFSTDVPWARAGSGFETLQLPCPLGRTTVAICNDLNVQAPAEWDSLERGPYELAEHCRREQTRVLVLLNAWLLPSEEENVGGSTSGANDTEVVATPTGEREADQSDSIEADSDGSEPNWEVLNYWAMRLRPLWAKDDAPKENQERVTNNDSKDGDIVVIVCNRFGHERGKTFAGSSAMLSMQPGSGRPKLLHAMGEREEGVSVWSARIRSR